MVTYIFLLYDSSPRYLAYYLRKQKNKKNKENRCLVPDFGYVVQSKVFYEGLYHNLTKCF